MPGSIFQLLAHSLTTLSFVASDLVRLLVLVSRSRRALAAENLFLRKQLALFQERKVKPQPGPRFHAPGYGYSGAHVLLAWRAGERQTRYLPPLAPQGIPSPLALEIPACWQTANLV
jgi:hypothetical protein